MVPKQVVHCTSSVTIKDNSISIFQFLHNLQAANKWTGCMARNQDNMWHVYTRGLLFQWAMDMDMALLYL
jgi:hypothetical protein